MKIHSGQSALSEEQTLAPQRITKPFFWIFSKSEWSGLPGCLHPQITHAMDKAQDNISSGDTIRVVFGVATVAIACLVSGSQIPEGNRVMLFGLYMYCLAPTISVAKLLASQWKSKQSVKTESACGTHWM
ncbi:hypothetical protein AAGW04_20485 [Pectobacterium aroidearum]|uniref:hypothetical protein n=1 Tax=Pectobacterium aroidearum TaxID=1201031 RepID=UPI0031589FC6